MSAASPAIRHATTAAVATVGLIAAIVSYSHMQQLGYHHGESWRSFLIPISIDGLMAAASMVLLTRRRNGLPSSPLAWVALVLGGIASLTANMADAQPTATAILYAGWAPLGFLLAFELLLQQRRSEIPDQSATQPVPLPGPVTVPVRLPDPDSVPDTACLSDPERPAVRVGKVGRVENTSPAYPLPPAPERFDPAVRTVPVRGHIPTQAGFVPGRPGTKPARGQTVPPDRADTDLIEQFRRTGKPPTVYALKQTLGVGSSRATRLLAHFEPHLAGTAATNGHPH